MFEIEILERIEKLEQQIANVIRKGVVSAVNESEGFVSVLFGETENPNLILEDIPYLTIRAGEDKTFWTPSVGESGLILSLDGDLGNAYFMPALNTTGNPIPETDADISTRKWGENIEERINKTTGRFEIKNTDSVQISIRNNQIILKAGVVNVQGQIQWNGNNPSNW